jgi:hypothetical protein
MLYEYSSFEQGIDQTDSNYTTELPAAYKIELLNVPSICQTLLFT